MVLVMETNRHNTNRENDMNLIDITDMTDAELDALLDGTADNVTDVTDMTDAEFDAFIGADDNDPTPTGGRFLAPPADFDGIGWTTAADLAARISEVVVSVTIYTPGMDCFEFRRNGSGWVACVAGRRLYNERGGRAFTDEDVIAAAKANAYTFAV